jgi:superfamily II DNA or RNA helicase
VVEGVSVRSTSPIIAQRSLSDQSAVGNQKQKSIYTERGYLGRAETAKIAEAGERGDSLAYALQSFGLDDVATARVRSSPNAARIGAQRVSRSSNDVSVTQLSKARPGAKERVFETGSVALRDYQDDVIRALAHPGRDLVVMATGTGKTIVFADYTHRRLKQGQRALVLAHRDELISQAVAKIGAVAPNLKIHVEKAERRAARDVGLFAHERHVVVASVQSLHPKRLAQWGPDDFDLIIVDEAHHATAPIYQEIFRYFGCFDRGTPLIGFTATAGRSDGIGLGAVFTRIVANLDIAKMVERGWLVPVRAYRVQSGVDLSRVATRAGDFAQGQLEETVNDDARNALIVATYEQYAAGRQTICFCAGVDHARQLAAEFCSRGIKAEPVWGAMPEDDRRRVLAQYAAGRIDVLTNFAVLTEGFDAPNTACILLARPTKSLLLLTQMVGRGTRPHESLADNLAGDEQQRRVQIGTSAKPDLLVVDVCDVLKRGMCLTTAALADLPAGFNPEGKDVFALRRQLDEIDPRLAARAKTATQLHRYVEQVAQGISVLEIDVLAATEIDTAVEEHSTLLWSRIGEDHYSIEIERKRYSIVPTALGTWELITGKARRPLAASVSEAFARADSVIRNEYPKKIILVDRGATWRQKSPTKAQLAWLLKKHVFSNAGEIPEGLTKGQASQLLDAAFKRRRAS